MHSRILFMTAVLLTTSACSKPAQAKAPSARERVATQELIALARNAGRRLVPTEATRARKLNEATFAEWHAAALGTQPPADVRYDLGPVHFSRLENDATREVLDWVAGLTVDGRVFVLRGPVVELGSDGFEDDDGGGGGGSDGDGGGGSDDDDDGSGQKCRWKACSYLTGGCCQSYEGDMAALGGSCPKSECQDDDGCCEGDPTCCDDDDDGMHGTTVVITDMLFP